VRHELVERARRAVSGQKVLVVTDTGVDEPWAARSRQALSEAGFGVLSVVLEAGEQHKNLGSIERIWDAALEASLDRDALVLAVGGGVVGDMAGFAASTILRGIAFGQLPTTLLAMVDSAVGGKTGIDRPQGKNLIGSFHQPRFVLCDVETLSTLPLVERRAGLAEVVKSAWLDGEESVAMLEHCADELLAGDLAATSDAVRMSVGLKARIVTEDEKESGARALLNLGHTIGHAIEAATGYMGLRHGEAVSLGMVAAFRLSRGLGVASAEQAVRVERLLARLGLPVDLDRYLDERALGYVGSDKKRKGGKLRFIVPAAPGETQMLSLAEPEIARLVTAKG
jgi:3-dehydroquinate synthase